VGLARLSALESPAPVLLAVSVDGLEDIQSMAGRLSSRGHDARLITFLSDPDHRVTARYGLLNQSPYGALPYPATYVIDRQGVVRRRFVEADYRRRPAGEEVLQAVRDLR